MNDFFAFRAVVQFLVLRGRSNTEIHCEMAEAYGDKAPSSQFVAKWALRFRRGRTWLEDDARSGLPTHHWGSCWADSKAVTRATV